jgi:hypothetical protein
MNDLQKQAFVEALDNYLVAAVGREMAKYGVIGKYPENFKKDIEKAAKGLIKTLI